MIDYRISHTENGEDYTNLLDSLKRRGLSSKNINVIVHDGEYSIRIGIKKVYRK